MQDTAAEGRAELITHPDQTDGRSALFGEMLMNLLRDPNIPADKLEVVMRMRRENIEYEAREAYQFHFAQFSAEMPPVERDGMVDLGPGKGRYPFTTYEQMDKILRPLLTKHGFSLQFWSGPTPDGKGVNIHAALIGWGWQKESEYPMPPDTGPGRNPLQAIGSSMTYGKRYLADLLCNIVRKGKDDDGQMGVNNRIDAVQIKKLRDLLVDTNTDEKIFLTMMVTGCEKLGDISLREYPRLIQALDEKRQRAKAATKK